MVYNEATSVAANAAAQSRPPARSARLRVAIVSDFLEEGWPSMDLLADVLPGAISEASPADVLATRLRPSMRCVFRSLPVLGGRSGARNADRMWNRFIHYPRWLKSRAGDFDIFHLVDHSYSQLVHSLPHGRTVVTCHDLDTFRCLLEPEREPRPRWFRAMTRRILDGFRQAGHTIAVSEATRQDLLRYELVPSERISVIPNGVHPSCSPLPEACADAEAARLVPVEGNGVLLNVGSTAPRKRLDVLLRVFAAVRRARPDVHLVRVGGFTESQLELARKLKVDQAIVNLPFLERDLLAAVYRRARVLLQTSDAEGFGLPVIESLACGCPVIASDIAVLREVGGPSVLYCPVADLDSGPKRHCRCLRRDPGRIALGRFAANKVWRGQPGFPGPRMHVKP